MLKQTKDLKLIYDLDQKCFDDFYSWELLCNLNNNHTFYLINNDKEVVGFIILNAIDENNYELIKIGILKQYQHQGYATKSMLELLNMLSFNEMFLEVNENNLKAIKLYTKLGFKFIYKRKHYYKNGNSALIFSYKRNKID